MIDQPATAVQKRSHFYFQAWIASFSHRLYDLRQVTAPRKAVADE